MENPETPAPAVNIPSKKEERYKKPGTLKILMIMSQKMRNDQVGKNSANITEGVVILWTNIPLQSPKLKRLNPIGRSNGIN